MLAVTVEHGFEAAHRLPDLGGKCVNLHGHSWRCKVTVAGPLLADGTVCEFGWLKVVLRRWIDSHLDHAVMIGAADPLLPALRSAGTVFVFGTDPPAADLAWPTVENTALLLARVTEQILVGLRAPADPQVPGRPGLTVAAVEVRETASNVARWTP